MLEWNQLLAEFLFVSLWQGGLIVLVAIVVSPLLGRSSARLREQFWFMTLVLSVAIPVLTLVLDSGHFVRGAAYRVSTTAVPEAVAKSLEWSGAKGMTWEWNGGLMTWTTASYLVVLLGGILALLASMASIHRLRETGRILENARFVDEWVRSYRLEFSMRPVKILVSEQIDTAVTIGFTKPVILLSTRLLKRPESSVLRAALLHELGHVRRRDFLWNLVVEWITLPFLFHPGIWFLRRQIRRYRELATDELVTEGPMDRRSYAQALLSVAEMSVGQRQAKGQMAFGRDRLEERIRWQISGVDFWPGRVQVASFVLALLMILTPALSSVLLHARTAFVQESEETERTGLHHVGDPDVTNPVPVVQTIPSYTEEAREAGQEGIVILSCIIESDGRVSHCGIERPLAHGLDESAVREIEENWRFEPGLKEGEPVRVRATIEIRFELSGGAGDLLSAEEAEGLVVKRVDLIAGGDAAEESEASRELIRVQVESHFRSEEYRADIRRLRERFRSVKGEVRKSKSEGVIVHYQVRDPFHPGESPNQ